MYDILIKNGQIVDGTGSPWFYGNVAVKDGKIAALGQVERPAKEVIDADGKVVSPGFIDFHTHSDVTLLINPKAESKIRQGVTLEVTGHCGSSPAPLVGEAVEEERAALRKEYGYELCWESFGEWLGQLERQGTAVNVVAFVGHGVIRRAILGYENRKPTAEEMRAMQALLAQALEDGAFGMSTGLIYTPGCFADTAELIELSKVLKTYGALYTSHIRDEEFHLVEAVEEAIAIGAGAGVPVQISHHKVGGQSNWGMVNKTLAMIDEARARGLDVTVDQYPYVATSTGLDSIIPDWAHEGGKKAMRERLTHPEIRRQLLAEVTTHQIRKGGWDKIYVASVFKEENKPFEGKNIAEIAEITGKHPCDAAFDLLLDEDFDVAMVRFAMCEEDVKTIMKYPGAMVGSDGWALAPYGTLSRGKPHPRSYGTFPRILGKYVREEKVISLEFAVKKMTGLPAGRLKLWDRGLLRPGYYADITVFDAETIMDKATYTDPHQYPVGIEYVIVNGQIVIDHDEHRGILPGKVLRRGR